MPYPFHADHLELIALPLCLLYRHTYQSVPGTSDILDSHDIGTMFDSKQTVTLLDSWHITLRKAMRILLIREMRNQQDEILHGRFTKLL